MQIPQPIAKLISRLATVVAEDRYERERVKFPESRVGALCVYGPETFVSDVRDALSQLQRCYPYGYSLVQRYVRAIVDTELSRWNASPARVVFVRSTSEGRLPFPPNRFAANLVSHAVVWRKKFGFDLFRSRKNNVQWLNRELHAMRLLKCDQKYFHRPTNLILNLEREET